MADNNSQGLQGMSLAQFLNWKELPETQRFLQELNLRLHRYEKYILSRKYQNDVAHRESANLNMAIGKMVEIEEIIALKPQNIDN
jgi:hypothetical protein